MIGRFGQCVKGKVCDSFGATGRWLGAPGEEGDQQNLDRWLGVDGKRDRDGNTRTRV